ncbi:MAG TPA: hypothetical protein V6C58_24660 [Allocoleopsis sp.]
MSKPYPEYDDFPIDEIMYGVHAPFVGIGVYTLDRKFSWPDPECTTRKEFLSWKAHIESQGYVVPSKYVESDFYDPNPTEQKESEQMTNHKTIEQWAEERSKTIDGICGYGECLNSDAYLAGAAKQKELLIPIIEEMKSLIMSQPRYTENNQQEIIELDSFKRAMATLESIEEKLKGLK